MIETIETSQSVPRGLIAAVGFLCALGLFITIPLIQLISDSFKDPRRINDVGYVLPPPPVLDVDTPPPPKKQQEDEDIEMDKEPPKLTLDQLDLALNPSTDSLTGGFTIDLSIDEKSLGTTDFIFNIEDVDERPTPLRQIAPTYPPTLRRQKIKGVVVLLFVVDKNGNVTAPSVESSTNMEFEKPALDAIRKWKFTPGKKGGEAVQVRVRLPIQFNLN